jgi:16S rRNA (adenine1518-N6/adenine1519-N6)-dimethyltransferase
MDPALKIPSLDVQELLKAYQLTPKKSLGQNFLISHSALGKIVAAADVTSESTVLEVGAGVGSLTRRLARVARRVVAVELDGRLVPPLMQALAGFGNVEVVQGDILEMDPVELVGQNGYLVVANIPYYITSAVIRHLLEARIKPGRMVLTMQQEVVERICSKAGDMSLLALSVQVYGKPMKVLSIPAKAFYPSPSVDSAVLRIDLYPSPLISEELLGRFFALIKAGFSQKRKTLRNALSGGMKWQPIKAEELLRAAGIDTQRRAETLSIEEWERLVRAETV